MAKKTTSELIEIRTIGDDDRSEVSIDLLQIASASGQLRLNITPLTPVILRIPTDQVPESYELWKLYKQTEACSKDKSPKNRARIDYAQWQYDFVDLYYRICESRTEKLWLCDLALIPGIKRLYQIASQRKITRTSEDLSDTQFWKLQQGDATIMTNSRNRRVNNEEEQAILRLREDPEDETLFSAEDDTFIANAWGRRRLIEIAKAVRHSETAVAYRARHLEAREKRPDGSLGDMRALRQAAPGYEIDRVAAWLGITEDDVRSLKATGVQILQITDTDHRVVREWVVSSTLAPFLAKHGQRFIDECGADKFFVKEIIECAELIDAGELQVEGCMYVDHGHICRNPWAGAPCGWWCRYGENKRCLARKPVDADEDELFMGQREGGSSLDDA